jgi:hypothetical protein
MATRTSERGSSLLIAMIVLVLATLMVVGAIAFTGQERTAAVLQSRSERLSGCAQAARNLFLSQVRVLQGNIGSATLSATALMEGNTATLASRHYTGNVVALSGVKRLDDQSTAGASGQVYDLSNRVGKPKLLAGYYSVTALCQEKAGGPEKEVEFVVRVGL